MAQTFDTSRVGGGTYELEQDSSGNYKLKSVGFNQVNKLNLPDLATSDTTSVADTTKKATEDTIKEQTTEVFTPTNVYNQGGGGQDSSLLNVPTVKDATVRSAGETVKSDMPQGSPGQLSKDKAKAEANVELGLEPQNQYRSQSQKFQERFDPTKIQAAAVKPNIVERATTGITSAVDSIKNNKAIQFASNALGFMTKGFSPVIGGLKMVAGTLQESPQDKFNKGYFNLNPAESGGRIAGNPADNVFAGMNAVSAFGNVRSGALGRIETRNSTKTQDRVSKRGKDALDKFNAKTKEFQDQVNKYDQDRADKKDAESGNTKTNVTGFGKSGFGRDTSQGGGDTGQGGGRVICTDLHKTGELSTIDWIRDTKFTFKKLTKTHVKGYLLWAEPTVKHIQKYPRYRKVWKHIAQHRANDIAWRLNEGKFDLLGRIYASIGEPVCWALGNFVSDKQINKYNLTHWRRA